MAAGSRQKTRLPCAGGVGCGRMRLAAAAAIFAWPFACRSTSALGAFFAPTPPRDRPRSAPPTLRGRPSVASTPSRDRRCASLLARWLSDSGKGEDSGRGESTPIVAAAETGIDAPASLFGSLSGDSMANTPLSSIASDNFPPMDLEDMSLRAPGLDVEKISESQKWDIYVCQSKPCSERGAGATLDAFVGLSPPEIVTVHSAILTKTKGKGPNVRCIPRDLPSDNEKAQHQHAFEVNNVDSVDKVYRILTVHMGIEGVDSTACECLRWNYRGNAHLEKGEITEAIDAYDRAINTGYEDQEGVVLLMRATAYLKRAFNHQRDLKRVVADLSNNVPDMRSLQTLYGVAADNPSLARPIFQRVMTDCREQDKKFRQIKYRHGLYEYALLHAARDSLRSTELLPLYAKTWLRAGDSLAELRKLKESAQYYARAMELDPSLADTLRPVIDRLNKSQDFLDRARANGWSEDTLRLALDVAG